MKDCKSGQIAWLENLPDALIRPAGSLPAADAADPELPEVGGLAEEVRQVGEADPRQLQVLQVEEPHAVVVHQRHVLVVQVEQVVRGFFNPQTFQTGTRIDEPREGEVVSGDEFQRVYVLPHVGDVRGVLGQRDV